MNTATGNLSFLAEDFPDSAVKTNFLHLGSGNELAASIVGAPGFYNAGRGMYLSIYSPFTFDEQFGCLQVLCGN